MKVAQPFSGGSERGCLLEGHLTTQKDEPMARSQPKSKQGASSLAALAARLDTRKRDLPADATLTRSLLRSNDKPANKSAEKPAAKVAVVEKLAAKPVEKSASKVAVVEKLANKPVEKPASKVAVVEKLAAKPVEKPATKVAVVEKLANKPVEKPVVKVAVVEKLTAKPVERPAAKVAVVEKLAAKPVERPVERPASMSRPATPSRVDVRPVTTSRPEQVLGRAAALSSLQRTPAAPAARTPTVTKAPAADSRRRYPRASIAVGARLSLADDPSRVFEATLPTVNISVGGLFLESSFFLKMGTKLLVELRLPPKGRVVNVKAEVVRVDSNVEGESGFALRFTEYLDGSEVILATHFLSPVLKEFLTAYAKQHRFEANAEYIAHTADVLAAWELKKAELGGDVWSLTSLS